MCTPACQNKQAAAQRAVQIVNRAGGINQQLAAQAYNERISQMNLQRIHKQQAKTFQKNYR